METSQQLRYSRQLAAYGHDMQQKIGTMKYLVYGWRGLGAEAAKHLILNGVEEVHLCDDTMAEERDKAANCFIRQIGQSRAQTVADEVKHLNFHVDVKVVEKLSLTHILQERYNGVIITEAYGIDWTKDGSEQENNIYKIDYELRENGIGLIIVEAMGLFGYIFTDFGEKYQILSTGVEEEKIRIKDITYEEQCTVLFKYEAENEFKEGDIVEFLNLEGSHGIQMLNEKEFIVVEAMGLDKIKINWNTSKFSHILEDAWISLKKRGELKEYLPLREAIDQMPWRELCGFEKDAALCKVIYAFRDAYGQIERDKLEQAETMMQILKDNYFEDFTFAYKKLYNAEYETELNSVINLQMFQKLVRSAHCEIITISSIFGGLAAVEALKLTGKYTPIDQWYAYNTTHCLPDEIHIDEFKQRYADNVDWFGSDVQKALFQLNLFLPGVGAIGWEALKCIAGLGMCTTSQFPESNDGKITVTDFDSLEISNLNRQFLFTDKDKGKKKVVVAKNKILEINSDLNIDAFNEKLNITVYSKKFNFGFWNSLDAVINGLDNIEGRVYLDTKCIEHEIPFLESGTQGGMAHTSMIMPFISNTYIDSMSTGKVEKKKEQIPFCTLRNKPTTIHHCTEWAISKFNDHFNSALKDARKFLESDFSTTNISLGQVTSLLKLLEWISQNKDEITLKSCLRYALTEFHKYFNTDIKKLSKGAASVTMAPKPTKFNLSTDDANKDK